MGKLTVLFVSVFLLFSSQSRSQVINIPGKTKEHFAKKYPGAADPQWTNNVVNYTCKFKFKGKETRAYYRMDGTWDFSATYLGEDDLPKAVKDAVRKSRISDWDPKSTALIENHKGERLYRVERKKGVQESYLFFDKSGKEVKSSYKL